MVDVDAAADGRGDGREIAFIGADDEIAAPQGAFDDAGVDDVGDASAARQGFDGPGPGVVESFGFASGQEPGELRLAGGCLASTGLLQGRGRVGTTRRSSRARWRAHIRRSLCSAAISAPEA
jgi:hypothetical protein